jgi:hypothetical protein
MNSIAAAAGLPRRRYSRPVIRGAVVVVAAGVVCLIAQEGLSAPAPPVFRGGGLTLAEINRLAGVPARFSAQPATGLVPDPDPRTACGARSARPSPLQTGRTTIYRAWPSTTILQRVERFATGQAVAILRAVREDARPGCPAFRTRLPGGGYQTVRFDGTLHLADGVGDERVALAQRIRTPGDPAWSYSVVIAVRERDCLSETVLVTETEAPQGFVRSLAAAAERRLEAVRASC